MEETIEVKRQIIRHEGDDAEKRFLKMVSGSRETNNGKNGDAIVEVDDKYYYIEIKECSSTTMNKGTINQIRPIKYIPLVIWFSKQ